MHEDEAAVAFLDLFPINPGHTLLVPKTHCEDLLQCPSELVGRLFRLSATIAPAIVASTSAAGFNVWTANGKAAGQEVFHFHLHILPRFEDDDFGLRFPKGYPRRATREELDPLARRVRGELSL